MQTGKIWYILRFSVRSPQVPNQDLRALVEVHQASIVDGSVSKTFNIKLDKRRECKEMHVLNGPADENSPWNLDIMSSANRLTDPLASNITLTARPPKSIHI
jgi:hypothetical protein